MAIAQGRVALLGEEALPASEGLGLIKVGLGDKKISFPRGEMGNSSPSSSGVAAMR